MKISELQIGQTVLVQTISGQWIPCTVLEREDGEFVMASWTHGYAIRRHVREIKAAGAAGGSNETND